MRSSWQPPRTSRVREPTASLRGGEGDAAETLEANRRASLRNDGAPDKCELRQTVRTALKPTCWGKRRGPRIAVRGVETPASDPCAGRVRHHVLCGAAGIRANHPRSPPSGVDALIHGRRARCRLPHRVVLAWAFDVSSSGVERTAPAATAGELKGARLALVLVGLGLVAAAPGIIYFFAIRGGGHSAAERTASTDAVPRSTSVAVLPFADMSPGKDQEYFADGIAEEILNALAQVEGLHVSGRTSSFSFKGKPTDLAEIGRRLNVATVLEGSVRKAGSQMRITAQLVNTSDGFHVWSRTFDRDLTDIFPVQEEIARDVVAALKVRLLPGRAPSTKWMRTSNPEVHSQYLLGLEFDRRGSTDDWRRALAAYEKALALDPEYAPAWAGVSFATFSLEVFYSAELQGDLGQRALAAADRAIALAPEFAEGYRARALVRRQILFDWA